MCITKKMSSLQQPIYQFECDHSRAILEHLNFDILSSNTGAIPLLEKYINRVNWRSLSGNGDATHLLERNPHKIFFGWELSRYNKSLPFMRKYINRLDWEWLCANPYAAKLLEENPRKIHYETLCGNCAAVHLIEPLLETDAYGNYVHPLYYKVDWVMLSLNHGATHILEKNVDKLDYWCLSMNKNAGHLLAQNLEKIDWCLASKNTGAYSLLEKHIDKIIWDWFSCNSEGIGLLAKNLGKLDWKNFSLNDKAIPILLQHLDKVDWDNVSRNTAIMEMFPLDYVAMKERNKAFLEELVAVVYHPARLWRLSVEYECEFSDLLDI